MRTTFKNRRIILTGKHYETAYYDIGTTKFCTQFNGIGGFNYFHYVDNARLNVKGESYFNIFMDGVLFDINTKKKVICGGRIQRIIWTFSDGKITLDQFGKDSFIFYKLTYNFKTPRKLDFAFDYTRFKDVPTLVASASYKYEPLNYSYYVNVNGSKGSFNVCVSFTDDPSKELKKTNKILKELNDEIDNLYMPKECDSELKKTLYTSSMFTALENYKEIPGYKAFTAGVYYLAPFRTYFRDSYWTILCLHKEHPELVRQQILTLAKGINESGECPSAVKSDYSGFWGGHYDSPCFFIMMLSDYIVHSKDRTILDEVVNDKTIIEIAKKVIDRVISLTDSTHLFKKVGPLNRLDWADAVNRDGYVTYDAALYYRALLCFGKLSNDDKYLKEASEVKSAINTILWNEEKGYYNNFVDGDYVEDNLSVDTILTVLFDIVPSDKKERLLDNFEKLLYSKNHKELKDFGVMTVYPPYKKYNVCLNISGQAYRYHNGANWPYWAGMFAYMLMENNRDYNYALTSWFEFSIKNGNLTPLEYLSAFHKPGSDLQAWSATSSFALLYCNKHFFNL